jgi:hypothetical protein
VNPPRETRATDVLAGDFVSGSDVLNSKAHSDAQPPMGRETQ